MKINGLSSKVSNNITFKANIKNYKTIMESIAHSDNYFYSTERKVHDMKSIKEAARELKKVGDPDTTLFPLRVTSDSGINGIYPGAGAYHDLIYRVEVTNKKFPGIIYNDKYKIPNISSDSPIIAVDFFKRIMNIPYNRTTLQGGCLKDNVRKIETRLLKHISNLAQKDPHEILEMYNVKDKYWVSIANEVKGYIPYTYPHIEQDRKMFNKSYTEYVLSNTQITP